MTAAVVVVLPIPEHLLLDDDENNDEMRLVNEKDSNDFIIVRITRNVVAS